MGKIWKVKAIHEAHARQLARELACPLLIAKLLIHRGMESPSKAHEFLLSDLSTLPPPQRLADLEKAVRIIRGAVLKRQKILLLGDYDVDGLTATALLYRVIRPMGAEVLLHIPHRIADGYGLKVDRIRWADSLKVKLLISLDCGTTSFKELGLARRLGIQTIVVDHHELLAQGRPPAEAFLNPLQPGCRYPNKELSSVGVAFTLARGLLGERQADRLWEGLDLVALGTVADLAPLVGENRILTKAGLHRLAGTGKVGLKALLSQLNLKGQVLTGEDISFRLAPRLNAAGRIGSAEKSLRLLITEDPEEAESLATRIEKENKERANLERQAFRWALSKVERQVNFARDRVIVLEDSRWHPGVIGIIATRVAIRFHRPTVVIALEGEMGRGSARSLGNFPWMEALERVREDLMDFGGHPQAAGLTIPRERIPHFREKINRLAHSWIDSRGLVPCLEADEELPLSCLTEELLRDLELLAPFGPGNPWPLFLAEDSRIRGRPRSAGSQGIRLMVENPEGRQFEASLPGSDGWEGSAAWSLREGPIRLAYFPFRRRNTPRSRIELKVRDLKLP